MPAAIHASVSCDQMPPIGMRNHGNAKGIWKRLFSPSNSSVRTLWSVTTRATVTSPDQMAKAPALSHVT